MITPLDACPDHCDELPEFNPKDSFSCGDCGYILSQLGTGESYEGLNGKTYPRITDKSGYLGDYGWVSLWTEVHFCFVCNGEIDVSNGT